jgi:hypothetical protein
LVSHVFVNEFFWLNSVFGKHPLGIFWVVLFQNKMGFCQTKSKKIKIKKNILLFLHMAKNHKII